MEQDEDEVAATILEDTWEVALNTGNVPVLLQLWSSVDNKAKMDAFLHTMKNDNMPMFDTLLSRIMMDHPEDISSPLLKGTLLYAIVGEKLEMLDKLISAGVPVRMENDMPLIRACFSGKVNAVAFLLSKGANAAAQQSRAVWIAVSKRNVPMTAMLLDATNHPSSDLEDSLRKACEPPAQEAIVRMLIRRGAPVTSALRQVVLEQRDLLLAAILLEDGRKDALVLDQLLVGAARMRGNADMLRLLICHGARACGNAHGDDTILYEVFDETADSLDMMKVLLENGCPVTGDMLKDAISMKYKEMIRLYLQHNAVIDKYLIHYTCANWNWHEPEIMKMLMDAGADLRYDNDTPLHVAAKSGNFAVVKFLIDHGASVESTDEQGRDVILAVVRVFMKKSGLFLTYPESWIDYENFYRTLAVLLTQEGADLRPALLKIEEWENTLFDDDDDDTIPAPRVVQFRGQLLEELLVRHPVALKVWYDRCGIDALAYDEQVALFGSDLRERIRDRFYLIEKLQSRMVPQMFHELAEYGYAPSASAMA